MSKQGSGLRDLKEDSFEDNFTVTTKIYVHTKRKIAMALRHAKLIPRNEKEWRG